MPGTASPQVQSRAHSKARPSANVRAANLVASTPVLFRLPFVPNVPHPSVTAAVTDASLGLPTAKLAAVSVAAAEAVGAQSHAALAASTLNAAPRSASSGAPRRTWWEHWSSGIVLIVLLIALATASILAWQGGDKSQSKLIAETQPSSTALSDLSTIEVPKLEVPQLSVPASVKPTSAANEKLDTTQLIHSESLQPDSDDQDSSLIPSEPLRLSVDQPADTNSGAVTSGPGNAGTATSGLALATRTALPEPHASASLQSPIVKPQEPLFNAAPSLPSNSISAQPASTATERSSTGASPSVWDSSKVSSKDTSNSQTLLVGASNGWTGSAAASAGLGATAPSDGSSIPLPPLTAPSTTNLSTGLSSSQTALVAQDAAGPSAMQFAGKTATPELDRAALFATFRQYTSANNSATTPEASANRYKAAAPSASGPNIAAAPTGTAASTVGYTLPPGPQYPAGITPGPPTQPNTGSYSPPLPSPPQHSASQYPATQNPSGQPQIPPAYAPPTQPTAGYGYGYGSPAPQTPATRPQSSPQPGSPGFAPINTSSTGTSSPLGYPSLQ